MNNAVTRQQRRAMQRHLDENEATIAADARFFERRPDRTYRIRCMSAAERAQVEVANNSPMMVTPGCSAFTVVKQIATGVRMKIFVAGPEDEDGSGTSDELGAFLWNRYAQRHPEIAEREAAFRNALIGPGGPLHHQEGGPRV